MAENTTLVAKKRTNCGSGPSRRSRRAGLLPCIVCGAEGKSLSVETNMHEFELILRRLGGENLLADLQVEGESLRKVLLKELQHDPVTGALLHADFVEISMTRKMRVEIPIQLVGEPVGVSQKGGVLEHRLRTLDVECLPGDMIGTVNVDVTGLDIGHSVCVRDVVLGEKLAVLTQGDIVIASVSAPVAEEVAAPEAATEEEAVAEPELIREKRKEREEETEGAEKPEKEKDKKADKKQDKKQEKE